MFEAASCALGQDFVEEVYDVLVGRTSVWACKRGHCRQEEVKEALEINGVFVCPCLEESRE